MSVEVLDGATIISFVEDEDAFSVSVHDRFTNLDKDKDGLLSYAEMMKELKSLRVFETHFGIDEKPDPDETANLYNSLFLKFDHDSNGSVDLEEFKAETKQMMLAMANGIGVLPIQMALEEDSRPLSWVLKMFLSRQLIHSSFYLSIAVHFLFSGYMCFEFWSM